MSSRMTLGRRARSILSRFVTPWTLLAIAFAFLIIPPIWILRQTGGDELRWLRHTLPQKLRGVPKIEASPPETFVVGDRVRDADRLSGSGTLVVLEREVAEVRFDTGDLVRYRADELPKRLDFEEAPILLPEGFQEVATIRQIQDALVRVGRRTWQENLRVFKQILHDLQRACAVWFAELRRARLGAP